jgi:hypothetical protein
MAIEKLAIGAKLGETGKSAKLTKSGHMTEMG